jgi:predicted metal-dependent phosphoesterase TrpH
MEFDLHMHSNHSFDSAMKVERMIRIARERGLRGIAITDHETASGGREGLEKEPPDLLVIPGFEKFTLAGDIIGLFCTECPDSMEPMDVVRAIQEQDGVVYLPHPFVRGNAIGRELAENIDCIEGFNARHARIPRVVNQMGEEKVITFAREYDITLTGGSDAHSYAEIGRGRTIMPADSKDEVKEALRSGNTAVSGKRTSRVYLAATRLKGSPKEFVHRLFPKPEIVPPDAEE